MGGLILRRLFTAIPTLLAIILGSFALMRLAPGGPFDGERPVPEEVRAALMQAYGLDKPLWEQLWLYLARLTQGDFGPSLVYRDFTVTQLVAEGLPLSLMLGGLAMLLALAIGLTLGLWSAARAGGRVDRAVMFAATLLTALPTFVSGPILVLIFSMNLGLTPVAGQGEGIRWLILPVVALSLPVAGAIAKLARAGLAAQLSQDHLTAARARGLPPVKLLFRHALRPAMVPVISYVAPAAASLLTGAVVIETVFNLPGLGRHFVQGAFNRDYPLVMAVVLLYAALIIAFNLLADIFYGWLDPRMREEGA